MSDQYEKGSVTGENLNPALPGAACSRGSLVLLATLGLALLCPAPAALAKSAPKPQKAIEALEGCTKKERKQACVNILRRRDGAAGKLEIKAEVRGGRIIWYEYDKKSGSVRRMN